MVLEGGASLALFFFTILYVCVCVSSYTQVTYAAPLYCSIISPVAVGDTGSDGEQGDEPHHAGRNDHVPLLLFLSLL